MMRRALLAAALAIAAACASPVRPSVPPSTPSPPPRAPLARELEVEASAYNSQVDQTDSDPHLTASGERLRPGLRALAVSDDLFASGMAFGTRVEVEGLEGEWIVMDRMHARWTRKIDVYMGNDRARALDFGERRVKIRWHPPN